MSDIDFTGVGYTIIFGIYLPLAFAFLISFFGLLYLYSKTHKFYIHSMWKRILNAFLLSFFLCPLLFILFYACLLVWQIFSGSVHLK